MINRIRHFLADQLGASMVEYGVALLVITAIGIAGVQAIGSTTQQSVVAACFSINGEVAC